MAGTVWASGTIQGSMTLSNLNLTVTSSSGTGSVRSTDYRNTGKFYFEYRANIFTSGSTAPGIGNSGSTFDTYVAVVAPTSGNIYATAGAGMADTTLTLGAFAADDILCVAVDIPNKLIWFRKNAAGNWNGKSTANPQTGVGGVRFSGAYVTPFVQIGATNDRIVLNSGDTAFTGTVPTGFTSGWASPGDTTGAVVSEVTVEAMYSGNPVAQITTVGVEAIVSNSPPARVTAQFVEVWASTASLVPVPGPGAVMLIGM